MFFQMDDLDRSEHDLNKKLFKDNEDIEFDKEDVQTFSQTHYNDQAISKQPNRFNPNNYRGLNNKPINKKLVKNYDNTKFSPYKSM